GRGDDAAPPPGALPIRLRPRGHRRALAARERDPVLAPGPDRAVVRPGRDARALRRAGLGLGRGPLDARRGERPRRARLRARRFAVRALRLSRRERVPGPAALGAPLAVRRSLGEAARMSHERSDALVFFGITGDLAYKKIFPALHAMARRGMLDLPVVGVASSAITRDALVARARASV